MSTDPAQTLAEHVCATEFDDLPEHAVTSSKRDILDTLGAALGGSGEPGIDTLAGLVEHWGGREESRVLLRGGATPAPHAALVNAAMGHALDFDDTLDHGGSIHPGVSTLFSSLAVADAVGGVSGRDLILAVSLGLDVACRIALASTVDRGWHRTALIGVFGAVAASGKLLGLGREQMANALGIAYSQAAGNRQCIVDGALTKRLQAGQAAQSGVFSALLAQASFTGAKDVFTGRFGFFPMYQPDGYDLAPLTAELGTTFRGAELSFKPYPCGRPNHARLDATLALHRELDLEDADEGAEIAEVTIEVNPQLAEAEFGPDPSARLPTQVVEAQFSLPFLLACGLALGRVGIADVARVDHPAVRALAARIKAQPVDGADAIWGRLTVRRTDGRTASVETASHASGSPERPLTEGQLEDKFRDCAANAVRPIPEPVLARSLVLIRDLEGAPDATEILRIFEG